MTIHLTSIYLSFQFFFGGRETLYCHRAIVPSLKSRTRKSRRSDVAAQLSLALTLGYGNWDIINNYVSDKEDCMKMEQLYIFSESISWWLLDASALLAFVIPKKLVYNIVYIL